MENVASCLSEGGHHEALDRAHEDVVAEEQNRRLETDDAHELAREQEHVDQRLEDGRVEIADGRAEVDNVRRHSLIATRTRNQAKEQYHTWSERVSRWYRAYGCVLGPIGSLDRSIDVVDGSRMWVDDTNALSMLFSPPRFEAL